MIDSLTLAALTHHSSLSKRTRARILKEEGPHALANAVFPPSLFNPEQDAAVESASAQIEFCTARGIDIIPITDPRYPTLLASSPVAPGALYVTGSFLSDAGIAIIGTRAPSGEAVRTTTRIARELARNNVTVVSGLALGVDSAAHAASLGCTVAVMGTGPDITYPAQNQMLRKAIEESGAVITQFPPGQMGEKHTFPTRNETMAAMTSATIIVEASENSGTKHQALSAARMGRRLIVMKGVNTTWGRQLIESGQAFQADTAHHALELSVGQMKKAS